MFLTALTNLYNSENKKLRHISGTILFPNEEPAGDVVIEVYCPSGKLKSPATAEQPRLAACVTGDDGRFAFPGLKPGEYVLRVGTRKSAGVNEMLVPIILQRHRWGRKVAGLKDILQLGT